MWKCADPEFTPVSHQETRMLDAAAACFLADGMEAVMPPGLDKHPLDESWRLAPELGPALAPRRSCLHSSARIAAVLIEDLNQYPNGPAGPVPQSQSLPPVEDTWPPLPYPHRYGEDAGAWHTLTEPVRPLYVPLDFCTTPPASSYSWGHADAGSDGCSDDYVSQSYSASTNPASESTESASVSHAPSSPDSTTGPPHCHAEAAASYRSLLYCAW
jgi:hypothetical protein